jgi:uncharacterized protein YacL
MNEITILLLLAIFQLALLLFIVTRLLPATTRFSKQRSVLLDTSAVIDGRIRDVVISGFMPAQLLLPRFVIAELQLLADKADHLKRERARYGLQIIQDLQESKSVSLSIIRDDIISEQGVDEKLVKLALKKKAMLLTTDYNLLKVAEIEGVRVLNINQLAQSLRPIAIPGERADIKVVARGQERTQGVGYLEDGTMVVVEGGGSLLNKKVSVEFTRNLQTTAGRMMFAKRTNTQNSQKEKKKGSA